jgi:hypothetical protein
VEEADKIEDEVGEDRENDVGDEVEGVKEAGGEKKGEEEDAADKVEKHSKTKVKDSADQDEREEEHENDEKVGEERGSPDRVRDDMEAMKQRVAANDHEGALRSWKGGAMNDKEEERSIGSGEEERMAGEED